MVHLPRSDSFLAGNAAFGEGHQPLQGEQHGQDMSVQALHARQPLQGMSNQRMQQPHPGQRRGLQPLLLAPPPLHPRHQLQLLHMLQLQYPAQGAHHPLPLRPVAQHIVKGHCACQKAWECSCCARCVMAAPARTS